MDPREELRIPVVPVTHTVLFPGAVVPLMVFEENLITLVNEVCAGEDFTLGVVFAPPAENLDALPAPPVMGTLAQIIKHKRSPSGELTLMVKGLFRIRILEFVQEDPYPEARACLVESEEPERGGPVLARVMEVFDEYLGLCGGDIEALRESLRRVTAVGAAVDMALACVRAVPEQRQELLETVNAVERAEGLIRMVGVQLRQNALNRRFRADPEAGFSLN